MRDMLNERKAKTLAVGDRLVWHEAKRTIGGTVTDVGYAGFTTAWDDGQIGTLAFVDMENVEITEA